MADEIWLDVLPSMRNLAPDLIKGATKAAKEAGSKAGKDYADAFEGGSDGASDAAVRELETAQKRATGLVSKLAGDVSKARQGQQKSAAAAIDAETRLTTAVEKFGAESAQAQAATLRLEAARGKAADDTRKLENAENGLREAQKALTSTTEQLETAQKGVGQEVKDQPKKWGKFGAALDTAKGKIKGFSGSVGGLVTQLAGAVGGAALLTDAFGAALEGETSVARLNAALGATPEQAETYGAAAGALYSSGFGDSMDDVSKAVDSVVSSMGGMRKASTAEIEKVTGYALNLAAAFDVDVAEAATTAGSMMTNGLAGDAEHAMDLITGAMQQIPASLRGEVLPVMDEYGKNFSQLGIDGETAIGMIVAASADGAIGMDKMGDALKEFTIRATDMSSGTSEVYETLGLDMRTMTNDLLAGGDTAEAAMAQIIHGLQGIKDPGEQAAASLALFGTPLEDLGTDQIPDFLGMVDPMGDAFQSLDESAQTMGETLTGDTATSLETLKRSFMGMLTEGIVPLLEPLKGFMDWATNTPGVLEAVGIALGVVAAAWAVLTLVASPWLAIAIGIGLAIAGLILVIKNWGSIMDWIKEKVIQPFIDWLAPAWDKLMKGMEWVWSKVLKPAWDAIAATGKWLWNSVLKPVFGWIKTGWEGMISGISWAWEHILKPVWDAVSAAAKWLYEKAIKPAMDWIGDKWDTMVDGIGRTWDKYGKPVFDAISSLLKGDFVDAFEHGKQAVKNIWDGVANIVRKPINFVINTVYNDGLKAMFNGIASKLGLTWRLPDVEPLDAFAKGGLAKPGWALVGEEGPELVNFSSPGRVYTAAETRDMLAGQDQAPEGALGVLAGSRPSEALLPAGGWFSDLVSGVGSAVGAVKDWVVGKIADGVRALTKPIKSTISSLLPGAGINELIRGGAHKLIDDMVGWAIGADDKKAAEQAAEFGGAVYDGPLGRFHRPSKGPYTSMYGPRWGAFHAGVDIAGGGPTYAALPGVVQRVGYGALQGRTGIGIVLNHGPGLWTYYGHNPVGGPQVGVGDQVKGGQHIGYQGATGNVTGTHLHFEVNKGRLGSPVNPMKYLHDTGGVHEPGTWSYNGLQRPEYVFTEPQWSTLDALAARGAAASDIPSEITVEIAVKDLEGIKTVEEFIAMARRRARQKKGS